MRQRPVRPCPDLIQVVSALSLVNKKMYTRLIFTVMKYRFTPFNIAAFVFLACCIAYTAGHYSILSKEEGWGIVGMTGLSLFGFTALVADLVIQLLVKNRDRRLLVCVIALIVWLGMFLLLNHR
jgi:hypothetical protein